MESALDPHLSKPTILLVDDDRHMRLFLKSRLAFLGADLQMAANGAEALEALAASRPDLILSDAVMPHMDGFEFCRRTRSDPALATIPFALLTSLSQNVRERALQAGADDYLSKSENDLVFRIRLRLLLQIALRAPRSLEAGPPPDPPSVLLFSRSKAIQTLLQTHLSKEGITTANASTPADVLDHPEAKDAQALVLDLEQGIETLEDLLGKVLSHPDFVGMPIMALASKAEEPILETLERDVQDRLLKPLDGPETRHRIKLLLRLARS